LTIVMGRADMLRINVKRSIFVGTDHMRRLRRGKRLTSSRRFSREQLRALKILAGVPRGIGEEMLVVAHGFSAGVLADLIRNGLATMVTETKMAPRGLTIEVERVRVTDDGQRALDGRPLFNICGGGTRDESPGSPGSRHRQGARHRQSVTGR
jgi:hypothetical protein